MLQLTMVTGLAFCVLNMTAFADEIVFRRHVINGESTFPACAVFDVNADGRLDIVSGGWWYAAPTWEKQFLRDVEEIRGRFDDYSNLPFDVNGDGHLERSVSTIAVNRFTGFSIPGANVDADVPGNAMLRRLPGRWRPGDCSISTATDDWMSFRTGQNSPHGGISSRAKAKVDSL